MSQMSIKTRTYIALIIVAGLLSFAYAIRIWHLDSPVRFAVLLVVGAIVAHWKVRIPSVNGTLSVFCVAVFLAVSELNFSEALIVVGVGSLSQCLFLVKHRPKPVQVAFNVCVMGLAGAVTDLTYHLPLLRVMHLASPVCLMISAGVFFFANTVPIANVIAMTDNRGFRETWTSCYLWSLPFYLVGSGLAALTSTASKSVGWQTSVVMLPIVYVLYRSYDIYVGRMEDERKHAEEISGLHLRTIETLALAIEAKDQTTANHLARVQVYALEIGKELKMAKTEIDALQAASLLHDIGKLAVPEHIISKPGKLTREEFEKMKIHPVVGAEILERVNFPYPVTPMVRSHHEKWNGEGYPDGLKGNAIPLGARILAAVDCLDALASDRQYRKALPLDRAMEIVAAESGKSFDPAVIEILSRRYRELEKLASGPDGNNHKTALSVDIKVERGDSPAAGFEKSEPVQTTEKQPLSFIASIASAKQEMQGLFELTRDLGGCITVQDAMSVFSTRLKDLIPFDCLAFYLVKDEVLKPEYVVGENFRLFSALEIPTGMGLSGWVAENVKPIVNGNPAVEFGHVASQAKFTTMRSALSLPLEIGDRVIGVLSLYHADRDAFSQDNLRVLLAIAPKLAQTVESTLRYQLAERSAATDFITGLPNTRSALLHLDAEIRRCERLSIPLTVVVGDLDGFKQINDELGHLAGNDVLQKVSEALRRNCRAYDYVARMGGDEFTIIMPEVEQAALKRRLENLQSAVVEISSTIRKDFPLSISLGVAVYGKDGLDADRLLSRADEAMYAAKRRRKLQVCEPLATLRRPA